MSIIQKAETEIKKLVVFYANHLKSKTELRDKINGIIKGVDKILPFSLIDRQTYLFGLKAFSEKLIKQYYDYVFLWFSATLSSINKKVSASNSGYIKYLKQVKTPSDLNTILNTGKLPNGNKVPYDMITQAKGSPNVANYYRELTVKLRELSQTVATTGEEDSNISLWQKAELDLRHEKQTEMIQNLHDKGVRYAWTSSHPDCSKRCEKWQGKLFDLEAETSELSNFRMRKKVDGNTVYCFNEVIHQKQYTKSGKAYENNIIVGFNCRHKLIPYTPNSEPPKQYENEDIKKQREINLKLRELERTIRLLKQKALLYKKENPQLAKKYLLRAKRLTDYYIKFANDNGYAWYPNRL